VKRTIWLIIFGVLVFAGIVIARLPATQGLDHAFAHAASPLLLRELRGSSFWWARFEGIAPPAVVVHRGLPDTATFVRLLDGSL